jgi:superfamily II DNA or RNA helicase
LTYYLQYIGRMLRPAPGKTHGIYLDQVGNTMRHGLPDEVREWSLDGRRRKAKPKAVFTCKACYGTFGAPFRYCPNCGEMVAGGTASRGDPERVEGELTELTREEVNVQRELQKRADRFARGRAQTLAELEEYGRSKGYRPGWAAHVFQSRQSKRRASA